MREPTTDGPRRTTVAGDADAAPAALLADVALAVFHLNGQLLALADRLASPAGLTAAWWQVLGAVADEPMPAAGIARSMGITRQSVQRIADLLVDKGLAEYVPNPAHRRAKLLRPTSAGRSAIDRIAPRQRRAAEHLVAEVGKRELADVVDALRRLSSALDSIGHGDDA